MATSRDDRGPVRRRRPWYGAGLRFECVPECGACCTLHDEFAYVYLEGDDLARLAAHFSLTERECRERYTSLDDGDLVLRMDQPDCPFLDGWRCGVYEARPTQCRTFPFWHENLRNRGAWRQLRSFCPGIDRGELHSIESIREHLSEREAAD